MYSWKAALCFTAGCRCSEKQSRICGCTPVGLVTFSFGWLVNSISLRIRLRQWVGQGLGIICKLKLVKDTVIKMASLGASVLILVVFLSSSES